MLIGKVRGSVVSCTKNESLDGLTMLAVSSVDPVTLEVGSDIEVIIDGVGAGEGELVLCTRGSSARRAVGLEDYPIDYSVVAIIDSIDENGKITYKKYPDNTEES